jgi:hypothetical protein
VKEKEISCIQCEKPFVFTVAEQQRFLRLGFDTPKRCPDCRKGKSRMIGVNERWKDRNNRKPAWQRSNDSAYLIGKSR